MSESEEEERLMELSDGNLLKCPQFTTPTRSVYFIVNCFCDESTGLGRSHVMFRGDESVMEQVLCVRLAVYDAEMEALSFATLGVAKHDPENEDSRVLMFGAWKTDLPLPLGGLEVPDSHITRLALIIFHTEDWKESSLKFAADIVSQPPMFRDGSRLKRVMRECGDAVLRIRNGRIIELSGAQDALDLCGATLQSFRAQRESDGTSSAPLTTSATSATSASSASSTRANHANHANHANPSTLYSVAPMASFEHASLAAHSSSTPLWLGYATRQKQVHVLRRILPSDIREGDGMDVE